MNTNGQVIAKVFNDRNINKDEKYMFLMFISMIEEMEEEITVSITTLMKNFQTKCKKKIVALLKSLEKKGYIEIVKSTGKTNKYKVIKNYINNIKTNIDHSKEGKQNSDENFSNLNTSGNEEPGSDLTRGDLDTSSEITRGKNDTSSYETRGGNNTSSKLTTGYYDTSSYIEPGIKTYEKANEYEENRGFNGSSIYQEEALDSYNHNINNNKYNNKNNIYINNNKNNSLYINIFNTWNGTYISNEKILYPSVKAAIEFAINTYGEEDVINAIENYREVYYGDHYYDYTWTLTSFLRKENGVKRFLNDGDIWRNYSRKVEREREEEKFKINIEDYID